jgi:hypothetical protein
MVVSIPQPAIKRRTAPNHPADFTPKCLEFISYILGISQTKRADRKAHHPTAFIVTDGGKGVRYLF